MPQLQPLQQPIALKRSERMILVGVFALLIGLLLYQTAQPPIIANYDMLNVSLLVLNRTDQAQFANDSAMRAGTWWQYYTPAYLTLLAGLQRATDSLELIFILLAAAAYTSLITGFYVLGRRVGLAFSWALLLAVCSGTYHQTALGLSWTGAGSEMAAARNLYLGLSPWLMHWALIIIHAREHRFRRWLLFGLTLGLLANLHAITGLFFVAFVVLGLLLAVALHHVTWKVLMAFVVGALPGVLIVYQLTIVPIDSIYAEGQALDTAWAATLDITSGYRNLARGELLGLRLADWDFPILLYTVCTILFGLPLLRLCTRPSATAPQQITDRLWIAFAAIQLFGAMLLLTVDWLVLLAGVVWLRWGSRSRWTHHLLLALAGVSLLALTLGWCMAQLGASDLLPIGYGAARLLMRGGQFAYPVVLLLLLISIQQLAQQVSVAQRTWLLLTVTAVLLTGFFWQRDPAQYPADPWLMTDAWLLFGVFLLLGWDRLRGRRAACILAQSVVVGQLIIRSLLLPPAVQNWSFTEVGSIYYNAADAGSWLARNTPPGSLIASDESFLRVYARRPQIAGAEDAGFLRENPAQFQQFMRVNQEFNAALNRTETLRAFCVRYGVAYVVVRVDRALQDSAFALVYENDRYRIYRVATQ